MEDNCDKEAIFRLVNRAYQVEYGDKGISFKCANRLRNHSELDELFQNKLLLAYNNDVLVGIAHFAIIKEGVAELGP